VPALAEPTVYSILGTSGVKTTGPPWLAVLFGAMLVAVQLHNSLAMARGERPRGGAWCLFALAVLAYAPRYWFGYNWVSAQFPLIASAPMVLRRRFAALVIAAVYVSLAVQVAQTIPAGMSAADYFYLITYYAATVPVVPAALYASARLVRVAGELQATRMALAQAAVSRERLRVSRDLHDLLGHSLSAISLKGDLAIRVLRRDPAAAQAEIESLTEVTREALNAVRNITQDGTQVTLERELDDGRVLLTAAGVEIRVLGSATGITGPAEEVLAWVVREGVTNMLRHAAASTATITVERRDGHARLEILNDGASAGKPAADGGHGLRGLAERLAAVSGTLSHQRAGDDRFRLIAEVPAAAAEETSWNVSGYSSPKTST
jgi:two-component system sensor histidine kinase DesK